MARDVLVVSISTVAFEAAFSIGGLVLDPLRSSLTPRMTQALIYTQDWLRSREKQASDLENENTLRNMEKGGNFGTEKLCVTNQVVSGDLVSDVPPGAVVASHRRHGAAVTAVLCSAPVSGALESGSGGGKDKIKKPGRCDIIGQDTTKQFLLCIATGGEIEKDTRIQKTIPRALGQVEIRFDLMDAPMNAFKRSVLQEVLDQKDTFQSLKKDVLPYLVQSQLALKYAPLVEENGNQKINTQNNQATLSRIIANASTPSFYELYELGSNGSAPIWKKIKCCAYIASNCKYCVRLNSIQAFMDINRDIISEANHLSGHSFSAHNNIIHPSVELGSKTTVSPLY
ncbi:hypothetical protein SLEP1_g57650 [Rubroshorea leprosula]|uniref:Translation initiation factor eIF2B subunit gamma n=1 Tax=Rubroshorea leprosula TaxID=152421 RepID=A0AAV5MQ58_9ROSI|nr:hypothetical protein SLEP1_g57650 [Rubroshorea leprosula]